MSTAWEHQPWAEPYRLALFEMNAIHMTGRIATARTAIWQRIGELGTSADQVRELTALYDALKVLRLLEGESRRTSAA